jgi:hypothetical protein
LCFTCEAEVNKNGLQLCLSDCCLLNSDS